MNLSPMGSANSRGQTASPSFGLGDVWYALFRHKWKVMFFWAVGIAAAGGLYVKNKPPYVSEAKLLVRYVVETRSVEALGPDGQVATTPSGGGANVINSEAEIIRSLDLCRQVAQTIGPARILPEDVIANTNANVAAAAAVLFGGLEVEVPRLSNVIKVSLTHRDPEIAQLALQNLIELYFKRHAEIHRGLGTMDAVLAQQTDQVRSRLLQADQELQDLRTKAGVVSLEDSRRSITEQMGSIRQMILSTEAELAEHRLLLQSSPALGIRGTNSISDTNVSGQTSASASSSGLDNVSSNPGLPTVTNVAQGLVSVKTPSARAEGVANPGGQVSETQRKLLLARLESLRQQERDLRDLRTKAGPAGTGDTKHSYTDQIGRIREMILAVETELAGEAVPNRQIENGRTNAIPSLSSAGPLNVATSNVPSSATTAESYLEYKALLARLENLHRQEVEYRTIYTDGNRVLIRVRQQLAEAEADRKRIEAENPAFLTAATPSTGVSSGSTASAGLPALTGGVDPNRVRALEAKLKVLYGQLEKQKQEAVALEQFETQLNQLQRKRELDEKNYRHFAAGLEQTRFDEALGSGKLANISVVQAPSPALLSQGKQMKMVGMALAAGLGGGIALALLIELMLDHSVRRSGQLETSLALPLLSTIPRARLNGRKQRRQIAMGDSEPATSGGRGGPDIPGWSVGHPLRQHIEALRDRTLMHFEGDLRKPKLIGVTGCREGAGVTTIACGLAAALSEVAEGRVLLINLDPRSQSLHPFLLGREACSVVDVVEAGKRETALIGNNLYVASNLGSEGNGSALMQPTNISRLLPKIKMSDYDYVVFDMPTVSSTSISGKLAGMVDLVFMVAESEKDSANGLKKACQLLAESNANYRVVLNKFERYVPKWLEQEV